MFARQLAPFVKKGRLIEGHNEESVRGSIKKYFLLKVKEED